MTTHTYALTVTLQPKIFKKTIREQYDLAKLEIGVVSRTMHISAITELTQSGNLHFHGIVSQKYQQKRGTFKQTVHDVFRNSKVFGFVCVRPLTDPNIWKDYCTKHIEETKKELDDRPIIFVDDLKLFDRTIYDYEQHDEQ